jgi:hypothetical protein
MKGAVEVLTRYIAKELGPRWINAERIEVTGGYV